LDNQRLICITAAQRAGTTALQNAIEAADVVNFGEVFHTEPLKDARGTFLQFATENNLRLVETRTRSGMSAIAERYVNWLRQQAAPRHLLIDVKLNSWFTLSGWWQYPHHEPSFLHHLKAQGAVVVLIWRDNLGDQVLSQFISRELGIWHNLTPGKVAGRTIKAPVERLQKLAGLIVGAEADMHEHLRNYPLKIVIRYEDLFEKGVLTEQFRRAFKRMVHLDLPKGSPVGLRPNSVPKRDIIENYDEVIAALSPLAEHRSRGFPAF
jgi:hypothetical protein